MKILKKGGSREKGGGGNEIHAPCAYDFFSMCLSVCVVANDPRTSIHHFIIVNAYWVCLATESMNEIYVNNFKDAILRKKKKQHSNTYQSTILSTKIIIHTISVADLFVLQIFINTLFFKVFNDSMF